MISQKRPAASMPVVLSFDRKAEIEECAAPSAVNFRVLSLHEMPEGFLNLGVTDFLFRSIHEFPGDLDSNLSLFLSFKKNSFVSTLIIYFKLTYLGNSTLN